MQDDGLRRKDFPIWKALLNQDAGTSDFDHQSSASRDVKMPSQVDLGRQQRWRAIELASVVDDSDRANRLRYRHLANIQLTRGTFHRSIHHPK